MSEAMKLKVDTGAVTVEVENEKGQVVGTFEFNPADSNILRRYGAVVDFFDGLAARDGSDQEDQVAAMNELCDGICRQFDYLLGYPVSEGLFKQCGPLSVMRGGEFFFEQVLDGLGGIIEKVTAQRLDKKMKRISKAVAAAPRRGK